MTKFYDTCSLLAIGDAAFQEDKFVLSSITLKELERIKTASNKDPDIKYQARQLLHCLTEQPDQYSIVVHKIDYENIVKSSNIDVSLLWP